MQHPVLGHEAAPAAQPAARHRFMALTGVFNFALLPISYSATHQQVHPDGDVVLRSGPTTLGWVGIVGPTLLFALPRVPRGGLRGRPRREFAEAARSRRFLPAAGVLLVCLFAAGVVALMGWAIATYTVFKYHTTVATRAAARMSCPSPGPGSSATTKSGAGTTGRSPGSSSSMSRAPAATEARHREAWSRCAPRAAGRLGSSTDHPARRATSPRGHLRHRRPHPCQGGTARQLATRAICSPSCRSPQARSLTRRRARRAAPQTRRVRGRSGARTARRPLVESRDVRALPMQVDADTIRHEGLLRPGLDWRPRT